VRGPRSVERLSPRRLWYAWVATWLVAAIGAFADVDMLIVIAGLMIIVIGLGITLDLGGIATRLGGRDFGAGPFRYRYSTAAWRVGAALVVVIAVLWSFIGVAKLAGWAA